MPLIQPKKGDKDKKKPKLELKAAPLPTLWERLRQIKKKDLAFILSGLSVLVLAPVAQHYMLKPSEGDDLAPGFATREGGKGGDVFEPGLGGLAPGGVPSEDGSDVITPLAARDPSSLISPPAGPPAPPKESAADTIRDALNRAVRKGSEAAVQQAALPRPTEKMATTLRGLASLAGSGQNRAPVGVGGGGEITRAAQGVPGKPQPRSLTGAMAPSDFEGAARSNASSSAEAIEALKSQAEKAARHMTGPGSAGQALQRAADASIGPGGGGGGAGGGGPGEGGKDARHPAVNLPKNTFELGESLAHQLARIRAQKEMDLYFKKREMIELLPYRLNEKLMNLALDKLVGDGLMKGMADCVSGTMSGKGCYQAAPPAQPCYCQTTERPGGVQWIMPGNIIERQDLGNHHAVIHYKGGGADDKSAAYRIECHFFECPKEGNFASPAANRLEQQRSVSATVGDAERSLSELCENRGGELPAEVQRAACAYREAVQSSSAALVDVQAALRELAAVQNTVAPSISTAHQQGLDPILAMKPVQDGASGEHFGRYWAQLEEAKTAYRATGSGTDAALEQKKTELGARFTRLQTALREANAHVVAATPVMAQGEQALRPVEAKVASAGEKLRAAVRKRDEANGIMDEFERNARPGEGSGSAADASLRRDAMSRGVNRSLAQVDEEKRQVESELQAWKDTVHQNTDVEAKLNEAGTGGTDFVSQMGAMHSGIMSALGRSRRGRDTQTLQSDMTGLGGGVERDLRSLHAAYYVKVERAHAALVDPDQGGARYASAWGHPGQSSARP